MQQNYAYLLVEPIGRNFHCDFHPELTPKQMLSLGVFGGRYMTDCASEFPADWFEKAKLCPERHDPDRSIDDERQIKRCRAVRRHIAQIEKNCPPKTLDCRPRQRQALFHWAYDSRKI